MLNRANINSNIKKRCTLPTNKGILLYLFAILYALFVVLFPWETINRQGESVGGFNDFEVYLNYFEVDRAGRSKVDIYGFTTLIQFFTGEVFWDYFIGGLSQFIGAYAALRFASFLTILIWALIAFRYIPVWWAIIFLANPTSIDVAMSAIRNGFAYALFLYGMLFLSGKKRMILMFISPFFHSTSVVLLTFFYGIKFWFKKIFKNSILLFTSKTRTIMIAVLPGIAVGIALTFLSEFVLGFLGDRRVGIIGKSESPSILQTLFWYILFAVQLTCSTEYIKKHSFTINIIAWYLIMNLYISWSYRIWGAMIPMIAISIWDLPREKRRFVVLLWVTYLILWYIYWTKFLLWITG